MANLEITKETISNYIKKKEDDDGGKDAENTKKIYLDKEKTSWFTISKLPQELNIYTGNIFQEAVNAIKPSNNTKKSKVMVFNKDKESPQWNEQKCYRWYKSYLNTPKFNENVSKSYMFSDKNGTEIESKLPSVFEPFYNYMNNETANNQNTTYPYNQIVANYYEKSHDFIPFHRDWTNGMVDNYDIAILTLKPPGATNRTFTIIPCDNDVNSIYKKVEIELINGLILTMNGDFQKKFKHGVPKLKMENKINQRISLTFRKFK